MLLGLGIVVMDVSFWGGIKIQKMGQFWYLPQGAKHWFNPVLLSVPILSPALRDHPKRSKN
ncbi:MAG: hypothetical protein EAZ62_08860 [Sphingobacteriia bacterium]|nr:MAG: hypothetical protein EAZ62_08860 [Sphingobacteriia bacterium]